MPVYTYRCECCGVQFEKSQKFSDQPLVRCPECGKKCLRKVYTPVGIVFKGSGFYSTDHKSPSGARMSSGHSDSDKAGHSHDDETAAKSGSEKSASEGTAASSSTTSSTGSASSSE